MNGGKHTPGPWLVEFDSFDEALRVTSEGRKNSNHVQIATISVGYSDAFEAEQQANARLIATAPNLHRELRGAQCPRPCNNRPDNFEVGACVDAGECGCSLGAAIAKAEGTP